MEGHMLFRLFLISILQLLEPAAHSLTIAGSQLGEGAKNRGGANIVSEDMGSRMQV